ncbi:hypothetical protein EDB89DRAFT_2069707 [Lactarius sanguifluus]|nr:hypothetical protein EDB89DRAFT_2069707 [Lactarius sanguifluus]
MSEPEIAQVACGEQAPFEIIILPISLVNALTQRLVSENDSPMVALFSEELRVRSWSGQFCVSQRRDSVSTGAITVPVSPPVLPVVKTPAPITVATQAAALQVQPSPWPTPGILVHSPLSFMRRFRRSRPSTHTGPHDDITMIAIQTSLAILKEGSSLATRLPYIAPIAGLLLQVLTMRDEVKLYKEECEVVMGKLARAANLNIIATAPRYERYNLGEEANCSARYSGTRELDRIERVLKEFKGLLLRKDLLMMIKQCDVELSKSNVLQAFQAELSLNTRVAFLALRSLLTPAQIKPYRVILSRDHQPSNILNC